MHILSQESLDQLRYDLGLGKVLYRDSLPSTNITAQEWLAQGCPNFSMITADQQTSGKGRLGRRWYTNPQSSLAFSLIITQDFLPPASYPGYVAVSISQALKYLSNDLVEIKWPNDILINGEKVCGVLTETIWSGNVLSGIIIGIGINVFESSLNIQEELRHPATFLQKHVDKPISRIDLLGRIAMRLVENHNTEKWVELHTQWNQNLAFKNQQIRAMRQEGNMISGTLSGVALSGELEIKLADSSTILYNANEIDKITPINDRQE
jgi:BirA family biotin operon repressor/biotin-[acetyl-CoA-carboxylase] ligase